MSGPTLNTDQIKRFLDIIIKIIIATSTLSESEVENKHMEHFHNKVYILKYSFIFGFGTVGYSFTRLE